MVISQGNCSVVGSHRGAAQHAYDFAMPKGTPVIAARAGRVVAVDDSQSGRTRVSAKMTNGIVVEHEDGTLASYVHLLQGSASVGVGQTVEQGQVIGLSGKLRLDRRRPPSPFPSHNLSRPPSLRH